MQSILNNSIGILKNTLNKGYTDFYLKGNIKNVYPNEYIIRIFKGSYPNLCLRNDDYSTKKIVDVGCGDGRNLVFLRKIGFDAYATEITDQICTKVQSDLESFDLDVDVRCGTSSSLPFENEMFDYLLSWNSCYYMESRGNTIDFSQHVNEFFRVLKPGGKLILSVPMPSNFIFDRSEEIDKEYRIIIDDPYGIRNNQIMRCFRDEEDIINSFSPGFTNFIFGTIKDDCFGQGNHWYLVVCEKSDTSEVDE